jgi:hypothetical protein
MDWHWKKLFTEFELINMYWSSKLLFTELEIIYMDVGNSPKYIHNAHTCMADNPRVFIP